MGGKLVSLLYGDTSSDPCQTVCMVSHFKIILCLLFRALREEGTSLGLQQDGLSIARKYVPQGNLMTHTFTKYVQSRGRF